MSKKITKEELIDYLRWHNPFVLNESLLQRLETVNRTIYYCMMGEDEDTVLGRVVMARSALLLAVAELQLHSDDQHFKSEVSNEYSTCFNTFIVSYIELFHVAKAKGVGLESYSITQWSMSLSDAEALADQMLRENKVKELNPVIVKGASLIVNGSYKEAAEMLKVAYAESQLDSSIAEQDRLVIIRMSFGAEFLANEDQRLLLLRQYAALDNGQFDCTLSEHSSAILIDNKALPCRALGLELLGDLWSEIVVEQNYAELIRYSKLLVALFRTVKELGSTGEWNDVDRSIAVLSTFIDAVGRAEKERLEDEAIQPIYDLKLFTITPDTFDPQTCKKIINFLAILPEKHIRSIKNELLGFYLTRQDYVDCMLFMQMRRLSDPLQSFARRLEADHNRGDHKIEFWSYWRLCREACRYAHFVESCNKRDEYSDILPLVYYNRCSLEDGYLKMKKDGEPLFDQPLCLCTPEEAGVIADYVMTHPSDFPIDPRFVKGAAMYQRGEDLQKAASLINAAVNSFVFKKTVIARHDFECPGNLRLMSAMMAGDYIRQDVRRMRLFQIIVDNEGGILDFEDPVFCSIILELDILLFSSGEKPGDWALVMKEYVVRFVGYEDWGTAWRLARRLQSVLQVIEWDDVDKHRENVKNLIELLKLKCENPTVEESQVSVSFSAQANSDLKSTNRKPSIVDYENFKQAMYPGEENIPKMCPEIPCWAVPDPDRPYKYGHCEQCSQVVRFLNYKYPTNCYTTGLVLSGIFTPVIVGAIPLGILLATKPCHEDVHYCPECGFKQ